MSINLKTTLTAKALYLTFKNNAKSVIRLPWQPLSSLNHLARTLHQAKWFVIRLYTLGKKSSKFEV